MSTIELYNLGSIGIVKDIPSHLLPPEAWSNGNNMRFIDGNCQRMLGYGAIFNPPSVAPGFIFNVPSSTDSFWLYANLAAVYGYNAGTHTDITRAAGVYTAVNLRDWNGCILGGVPILNNGADVPQYWPTLALGTDLANLSNWTATLRAKVIRNFGRYLIAMNLNDNGTLLPHALQWSHPADPGAVPSSWSVSDPTVDAGRTHLTDIQGGELFDGYALGSFMILYKQRSAHIMRYIGGNDIFAFDKLFEIGVLAPRCACPIDAGLKHFVVSEDDVITHGGTKAVDYVLDKKDRRYLFADIDTSNYLNSFVFENPVFEEVWFAYPASGSTFPNKALVYNYRNHTCAFKDFQGLSVDIGIYTDVLGPTWANVVGSWDDQTNPWQDQGRRRIAAADNVNTKIWGLDNGYQFGATAGVASSLQRTGLAVVGKDRQGQPKADYTSRKFFKRIWPKIKGNAVVQVRLGAQEEIDGTVNWSGYKNYDPALKYLDFEVSGRLGAVEFLSNSDENWQVDGYNLELEIVSEM